VEVCEALGAHCAAQDVFGLKRSLLEVLIFTCGREHIRRAALHLANAGGVGVFVSDGVSGHQRVGVSSRLEKYVCHVLVIHGRIVVTFPGSFSSRFDFVPKLWLSPFNVRDFHNVSGIQVNVLSLDRPRTLYIVNFEGIFYKFRWLGS